MTSISLPGRRVAAQPWAALPVLLAGTFMIVLDFFIVNVALPAMQRDLGASSGALEWVVAGYGLTFATLLIAAGRLGDRHGRRRLFAIGLALFTVTSALCGLAWSPAALVVARFAQGAAAAILSPQVLSIINATYTGARRGRAMGAYGLVLGLAAVGGQLIGGALIEAGLGWRGCFLINVPIGLVALAALARSVPESRGDAERIDWVGVVLVTVGLTDVILPLVEGRAHGWPAWTWLCLAAAPLTLAAFAVHQRRLAARGGEPLTPPALFAQRGVRAGLVTQTIFWCQQAAFFFVFALYVQPGRGLDALQAGLVFTVVGAAYLVTSFAAPALTARHGSRLIVAGGLTLAAGHLGLALAVGAGGTGVGLAWLVPGLLFVGGGMGLCIAPLMATVMDVPAALAGSAAGVASTDQQVGNALGVAITGVLFFGALHRGYGAAFTVSEYQLAGVALAVALVAGALRARR